MYTIPGNKIDTNSSVKSTKKLLVVEGGEPAIKVNLKEFKPIPESGIQRAVEIMRSAKLYRYQALKPEESETSLFEKEFAEYVGAKYAVAVNSCGSALFIALKCAGVVPNDKVLMNAFTFTAVPSAIHHTGAIAMLVESGRDFTVDTIDLRKKASDGEYKVLLLSYMRGQVPNMDEVVEICKEFGITLIEDCAHAHCTYWKGVPMGRFGHISCFSTQSSKALSAGEGGIIITDDDEMISKAVLYSGSYERLWERHYNLPKASIVQLQNYIPSYSLRMNEVTAAMLRPQIKRLPKLVQVHDDNYNVLADILMDSSYIELQQQNPNIKLFRDTIQFHLPKFTHTEITDFMKLSEMEGIPLQLFATKDEARYFRTWAYLENNQELELTELSLDKACGIALGAHLTKDIVIEIGATILRIIDYIVEQR